MKKVFVMMMAFCAMLSMMTSCGNGNAPKGYKATNSGLYYQFHVNNGGELPNIGDLLEVTIACYVNDTTTIIPASNNILQLKEPAFATDFMEGVAMMHKGDSASFIVNIDSTFYYLFRTPELPEEFNSTDVMRFDVKVNDFYPESEYVNKMVEAIKKQYPEETERAYAEMQQYFAENNVVVTPTASGLYYVMTEEGNGVMPIDLVKIFGVDAYRYYFMTDVRFGNDGDISMERMELVPHGGRAKLVLIEAKKLAKPGMDIFVSLDPD